MALPVNGIESGHELSDRPGTSGSTSLPHEDQQLLKSAHHFAIPRAMQPTAARKLTRPDTADIQSHNLGFHYTPAAAARGAAPTATNGRQAKNERQQHEPAKSAPQHGQYRSGYRPPRLTHAFGSNQTAVERSTKSDDAVRNEKPQLENVVVVDFVTPTSLSSTTAINETSPEKQNNDPQIDETQDSKATNSAGEQDFQTTSLQSAAAEAKSFDFNALVRKRIQDEIEKIRKDNAKDVDKYKERIIDLERQITCRNDQLREIQTQLRTVRGDLTTSQQHNQHLQNVSAETQANVHELEKERLQLAEKLEKAEESHQAMSEGAMQKIDQVCTASTAITSELGQITGALKQLQGSLTRPQPVAAVLEATRARFKHMQKLNDVLTIVTASQDKANSETVISHRIDTACIEIKNGLQTLQTSLSPIMDSLGKQIAETTAQELQVFRDDITKSLEQIGERIGGLPLPETGMTERLVTLKQSIDELLQRPAQLPPIAELDTEKLLAGIDDLVKRHVDSLQQGHEQHLNLCQELATAKQQIDKFEEELKRKVAEIEQLKRQVEQADKGAAPLHSEVANMRGTISQLEMIKAKLEGQVSDQKADITRISLELVQCKVDHGIAVTQVKEMTEKIRLAEQETAAVKAVLKARPTPIEQNPVDVDRVRMQIQQEFAEALSEQERGVQIRQHEQQRHHENQARALEVAVENLGIANDALKKQAEDARGDADKLQETITSKLQQELVQAQTRNSQAAEETKELKDQIAALNAELVRRKTASVKARTPVADRDDIGTQLPETQEEHQELPGSDNDDDVPESDVDEMDLMDLIPGDGYLRKQMEQSAAQGLMTPNRPNSSARRSFGMEDRRRPANTQMSKAPQAESVHADIGGTGHRGLRTKDQASYEDNVDPEPWGPLHLTKAGHTQPELGGTVHKSPVKMVTTSGKRTFTDMAGTTKARVSPVKSGANRTPATYTRHGRLSVRRNAGTMSSGTRAQTAGQTTGQTVEDTSSSPRPKKRTRTSSRR